MFSFEIPPRHIYDRGDVSERLKPVCRQHGGLNTGNWQRVSQTISGVRELRKKILRLATGSVQRSWATVELQTLRRLATGVRRRPASRAQLEVQLLPLLATRGRS